jgi:bZIP transcription factor
MHHLRMHVLCARLLYILVCKLSALASDKVCLRLAGTTSSAVAAGRDSAQQTSDTGRGKRGRTAAPSQSGGAGGMGGGRASSDKGGGRQESVVEKRLKQNREAARRSRERKRLLKEELQRRMPILQKQHDHMVAEVDELMKSMWVRPLAAPSLDIWSGQLVRMLSLTLRNCLQHSTAAVAVGGTAWCDQDANATLPQRPR